MSPVRGPVETASRRARWRNGWRLSLTMARRDARRYGGRSALVVLLVALPIALVVSGLTVVSSITVSAQERIPWTTGTAQAVMVGPLPYVPQPVADSSGGAAYSPVAEASAVREVPGLDEDAPLPEQARALSTLTGGQVVPVSGAQVSWPRGEGVRFGNALFIDPTHALGSRLALTDGRWPADSSEIVVTPFGLAEGLPPDGQVVLEQSGTQIPVTVVGEAEVYNTYGYQPVLLSSEPFDEQLADVEAWLLLRDEPVSWEEVARLKDYGLQVDSTALLREGAQRSGVNPDYSGEETTRSGALLGAALFVVTVLLVGPAFAVGASRQRRTLALSASNGAPVRQLRRIVLAQAVVLGGVAVAAGVVVGVAGSWVLLPLLDRLRPEQIPTTLDPPLAAIGVVALCGGAATLSAALLPARRLGRLDIVGVMRGHQAGARLNRWVGGAGAVVVVASVGLLLLGAQDASEPLLVSAVVGLFGGTLLLVPAALVLAGRLGSRLSLPWRLATRDAARHRSRAVPTIAALVAATATLTTVVVAVASESASQERRYTPLTVPGEGTIWADGPGLTDHVTTTMPALSVSEDHRAGAYGEEDGKFLTVVPAGCAVEDTMPDPSLGEPAENRCVVLGNAAQIGLPAGDIEIWPAEEMVRRLGLDEEEAAAVRGGSGVLVRQHADLAVDGSLPVATGSVRLDQRTLQAQEVEVHATGELPVVPVDGEVRTDGRLDPSTGLVVPLEVARARDWPTTLVALHVWADGRAISMAEEERLAGILPTPEAVYIERGYQREDGAMVLSLYAVAAFLLLTVSLIATALALAEQQEDQATLAAVGATRRTRRRFAAAQAATTGLLGGGLGAAVGLVLGAAVARLSTGRYWDDVTGVEVVAPAQVAVPLLPLALVLLGVPLVAAGLAALGVRRAPTVTRRMA